MFSYFFFAFAMLVVLNSQKLSLRMNGICSKLFLLFRRKVYDSAAVVGTLSHMLNELDRLGIDIYGYLFIEFLGVYVVCANKRGNALLFRIGKCFSMRLGNSAKADKCGS